MLRHAFRVLTPALVGVALGFVPIVGQAADHVSVSMSYTPWSAYIPLYVGTGKGFYDKAGLQVDIRTNRGAAATMAVGTGEGEFGYSDSAAAMTARAKGVPLVVTANLQQDNGAALFATEQSGITRLEDLKGRNIGAFTGSPTTIFLEALLNKTGLSMNDVNIVTVRSGTDLPLVLNGGIDAEVTIFNNELTSWPIEHPGLKLRIWRLRDIGFATPGYGLITSEKLVAERPDLVRRFTKATIDAQNYALANPDDAVKILVAAVPELKPNIELAQWRALVPTASSASTEKDGAGAIDRPKWETLKTLLTTYKVIDQDVDLKVMLRDDLRTVQ
jgi:NitT/TauT family transport system substrate-binding protein